MNMSNEYTFEALVKPGQEVFDFWVSFSPMAPLFGVEWRFSAMAKEWTPSVDLIDRPAETEDARAVDTPAPVAIADVAELPEPLAVDRVQPAAVREEVETGTAAPADGTPKGLLARAPANRDDLTVLKGVGAGTAKTLNALGLYTYRQIAGLSDADLAWVDARLNGIKGNCFRSDWVGQARTLVG